MIFYACISNKRSKRYLYLVKPLVKQNTLIYVFIIIKKLDVVQRWRDISINKNKMKLRSDSKLGIIYASYYYENPGKFCPTFLFFYYVP